MTQAIEWVAYQGHLLYDPGGNAIDTIEGFYIDRDDGQPVWALIYTGPADMLLSFVPLREARIYGNSGDLQVSVSGDEVRDAPSIEAGGALSHYDERRFISTTTRPTPKGKPGLMTVIRARRTPTSGRASASRACSEDSSTATVTPRRPAVTVPAPRNETAGRPHVSAASSTQSGSRPTATGRPPARPATVLNAAIEVTRAGGAIGVPGLYVTEDRDVLDPHGLIGS